MAEPTTALTTTRQAREVRVVENQVTGLYDTARFEHMQRIAQVMANASLIPDHLRGGQPSQTLANCFMLVNQADRWQVDPFSIAPETYSLKGKLGYSGKLVAAIINTRAGLKESLKYTFTGEGQEREVTVHGTFEREKDERTIELKVKDAKTENAMWTKDPDQKLIYSGATKWARRHCPEILLGVVTDDDLERIAAETAQDVTPRPNRDDYVSGKPTGQIIDGAAQEKAEEPAEAAQATPQAEQAEAAADTPATQDEQQSEADHPEAWTIIAADGGPLYYDDPADFAKCYPHELQMALKEGGVEMLKGFIESNADELKAYGEQIDAKVAANLVAEGNKLLPAPAKQQSGTLDLDAPLKA